MNEPPKPEGLGAVVTIAALYGAGGGRIGPRVAERLGVQFLDRAIPSTVAKRAGLSEQAIAEVDDSPQSRSRRLLAMMARASPPSGASGQVERLDLEERRLRAEIEEFLADASRSGGVMLGRGGAIVLAELPGALHVYLGGDRNARVEQVMQWQAVDWDNAAYKVKVNDRARRDYVRSTYGVDGDNPQLYHLMVDAIAVGVDVCVDLIVAASESRGRRRKAEVSKRHAEPA